ncbi:shufflon system plasmid conjugative transfer pilus tip adhesin PilV [Alcaligenes phenolicus]|jgi:type II secretory pathway pseudopilin PulG|uniref:Shufflon system plasmid conjugative transfer pilus tip adhesin PilV n=1 Tax=Alcaligenes phenolicus TaxID=232846 RepID=A0AAW5VWS4_9BURK|nr:shufflon system plasmid conjugative transfer pilus tip adhesin PilV [Alcaligenes phenolicus]MCX5565692.1 shufflon system plasmid conjugative transfer pilus tip adhesin PilV [Alcaligenes phenolicus]
MKKFKKRVGMTLIETTIVMIVATAALAAGASMYSDYLNGLTNKSAAHQMKEVTDAFSRYMDDNHMSLRALVPGVGSRTTVAFGDLQSGGYLPAAFENRTPFNHEYVLTVRRATASGALQGLVHTSYTNSSFAIEPKHAMEISRMVGVSGGYTADIDPQDVISTYGNYNLDLATFGVNPGPGVLVSAIAVDHATKPGEKYLHRNVTGDPAHNRMNTHIDMDNNNLNNVHTVSTHSLYASVLVDTQRIRADVGDITTLTASLGEINTVNAETITTSSATVTGDQTVGGTLDVAGRITAGDHITLTTVVTEGEACGPDVDNGTVARDNAGMLLSCQGGVWKATAGAPTGMYAFFGSDACPDGWLMADGTSGTLDLRGEFIRGWDAGRGADPGRLVGSAQGDAIRNITGYYGSGS